MVQDFFTKWKTTALCAGLLMSVSCVRQDYDLSKDLNKDGVLEAKIAAPLGSTEKIKLSELLGIEVGSDIKTDVNGDYYFGMKGQPFASEVKIPHIMIPVVLVKGLVSPVPSRISPAKLTGYKADTDEVFENELEIGGISTEVEEVEALTVVPENAKETTLLKLTIPGLRLKVGYSIILPAFISLVPVTNESYEVTAHAVKFLKDVESETPVVVPLVVDKFVLAGTQGVTYIKGTATNALKMKIKIQVKGTVEANGKSVSPTLGVEVKTCKMKGMEVTGKLNPKVSDMPDQSMAVNNIPGFFKNHDTNVDLDDVLLNLDVANPVPVDMKLVADLITYKDGKELKKIALGARDNPIYLKGGKTSDRLTLCAKNTTRISDGRTRVLTPELNGLLQQIPDRVALKNIRLSPLQKNATIELGKTLNVRANYDIMAYLALGTNFYINYSDTVTGLKNDLKDINLNDATITATIINELPMLLEFTDPVAIDEQGKSLNGIIIRMHTMVQGGTLQQPAQSKATMVLTVQDVAQKELLDGFVLKIKGSTPKDGVSNQLNQNQTVRFADMKVRANGSIKIQ